MFSYWDQYPNINTRLTEVCQLIEQRLTVRNREISAAFLKMNRSGGKLLRPAFFYIFAEMGENAPADAQNLVKVAASLELLHMASLIHDDIIDDSPLRRSTITLQAEFGKDIAVYAGDYLFTVFFELVTEAIDKQSLLLRNARSMKNLLLGELDQMNSRFNAEETLADYFQTIDGKTAELFALSCLEGAYFAGLTEEVQQLAENIGRNIGLAFQIYDDILDYTATSAELHKPILEDLAQGVYTLPLLLAKEKNPADFSDYFEKGHLISETEAKKIAQLVVANDGVLAAKKYANDFSAQALADIEKLPAGKSKKQLLKLTKLLLKRSH
ncbi:polyprenyl synthetase family protein [Enterococcus sp. HY326]|uniref:polyprenyl synthetase family protein n=1 Tax=Enterococcus sp. HY326 TaxID=2971265 RepID=UPI002240223B|nr:polyprenyl synthetase family protein [Enterococcus sp. HY326]